MTSIARLLALLLLALRSPALCRGYVTEQVESRPIDGHRFIEGKPFRFTCRAVGNSDLAVRMLCPLTKYAPSSIVADTCFENCGRPLCNQPTLHDCAADMPELNEARCERTVSQLIDGSQEIIVQYYFPQASVRMGGTYACQYKNMRSSVALTVDATTTASTTTTTTSTATKTSTTASTSSSTTSATTTATRASTTTSRQMPVPLPVTAQKSRGDSAIIQTTRQNVQSTTTPAPAVPTKLNRPTGTNSKVDERFDGSRTPQPPVGENSADSATLAGVPNNQWIYNNLVGKLAGIDIVLIVLLLVLAIVLLTGFLFIRCQVQTSRQQTDRAAGPSKPPLHTCCSRLLCISVDESDAEGGPTSIKTNGQYGQKQTMKASLNYRHQKQQPQQQQQQQRLLKAPSIQPFHNGSDTTSGQVYAEANLDSSYYSQGEASDTRDAEYRLQTHFDAADARGYPIVSGSQRGPRPGAPGSFFNRDAPDRHSFHNVRASRQRPAIPVDLLMRAGGGSGGGGRELSREEIHEQMEKQRLEIETLRQILRDSQQQLSRLANSQQELHRSVSVTRVPAMASTATTPDEVPTAAATSPMVDPGDYELLAGARSASSPMPPSPTGETQRSSADLLQLAIDEPIQEELELESQESLQYPTVRSANKRRSSIGEAYTNGRLCPA